MSSIETNQFLKTLALISAGALFGYAYGKNVYKQNEPRIKHAFNFNDVIQIQDYKHLLKFLKEKLKNYPSIVERNFIRLDESEDRTNEIRVMQWNMLAKALCYQDDSSKAPIEVYDWNKFRLWRTLEEMVRHDSDILCIEEIDAYEEIKPYMHSIGYSSIFCPKFFSPCLEMESNIGPDGCAIFYRLSKFQPVNMSCEKVVLNSEINSQVFIILQLKHKQTGNLVTIVCLHLKSKVEFHEKREAQIKEILKSLKSHLYGSFENIQTHPVIVCGDFNGEPFEKFYDLIKESNDLVLTDAYSFGSQAKLPTTIKYRGSHDTMIKRAIDYLFYTEATLKLTEFLELPLNHSLINEQGLPNLIHSSDHLSLVASFKFI